MINLNYWLFTSYRRKTLDKDLFSSQKYFKGKILDVGAGRERGLFQKIKKENWLVVDIDASLDPDIVAPVEKLPFKKNYFSTIKATDLFGYVENPQKGFEECFRVLKKNGNFIFSTPYMTPYDNEQHDSQRFTEFKLRKILKGNGFEIIKFKSQGYFFTVWADMTRDWIHHLILPLRYLCYVVVYPILDALVFFEEHLNLDPFWKRYTTGFFIVAKKP